MVNIDKGYDYFQEAYAVLEKTGTIDHCVIKAGLPYERVKAENGDVLDKVIFMPIVNLHKEGAEKIINDYQSHMKPTAYELVFNDDNEEILRLIRKVRDSGAKLFINSLWPELCGGHDDDRAVELHQPDESWGWILNQGAKLIQTQTARHYYSNICVKETARLKIFLHAETSYKFLQGLFTGAL